MTGQLFSITFDTAPIQAWLEAELKEELTQQGHVMTGELLNSITTVSEEFVNGDTAVDVLMLERYRFTERGVRASRIPFGGRRARQARGGTSEYIQGLVEFVLARRMTTDRKKALGIAFAIAHTQKKQGQPTRGSFDYSKNGRRLKFQQTVLAGRALKQEIRTEWREQVQAALDTTIAKLNRLAA